MPAVLTPGRRFQIRPPCEGTASTSVGEGCQPPDTGGAKADHRGGGREDYPRRIGDQFACVRGGGVLLPIYVSGVLPPVRPYLAI